MANVKATTTMQMFVTFTVSEDEARALVELTGYGEEQFIKAFYEKLGKTYMEKHEQGLRTFIRTVKTRLPEIISDIDYVQKYLADKSMR